MFQSTIHQVLFDYTECVTEHVCVFVCPDFICMLQTITAQHTDHIGTGIKVVFLLRQALKPCENSTTTVRKRASFVKKMLFMIQQFQILKYRNQYMSST